MSSALSHDELEAYFALRTAGDRLQRAVTGQLREHGLTEVQFSVLATLAAEPGGLGMTDLARALVVTKSGLTYQATQMEARGLVARSTSAEDERAVRVELTPAGLRLLAEVMPGHVALVRELLIDRIDPTALATVRDALRQVTGEPRNSRSGPGATER
jgi:DNA-binding MarR family transcriptional regulator